jgi:hypothetical protein
MPAMAFKSCLRGGALFTLLILSAMSGCTGDPDAEASLGWDQVTQPGFTRDVAAALYMSKDIHSSGSGSSGGAVAFIRKSGKAEILRTGRLDNGGVVANKRRDVAWWSQNESYVLAGAESERVKRSGEQATGHWFGTRPDGTFVSVFNTGAGDDGYATDVYWTDAGKAQHAVIPDVPSSVGLLGDKLYVSSARATPQSPSRMFAVDFATGTVADESTWNHPNAARGWGSCGTSNMFASDGLLWFYDEVCRVNELGEVQADAHGITARLALASLNPKTGQYQYEVVREYAGKDSYITNSRGGWDPLAQASIGGHFDRGSLYTIDGTGMLLATDVRTGILREVGSLADESAGARDALIGWSADRMTVLFARDSSAELRDYSLRDGALAKRTQVTGLLDYLSDDSDMYPWALTALPPR